MEGEEAPHDPGFQQLVQACAQGDTVTASRLLDEGVPVNRDASMPLSPLFAAACEGQADCLAVLLSHGEVSIDDGDNYGRSPLYAACLNGHLKCAGMLAAKGANIAGGGGPDGGGALHAACRAEAPNIVQLLLQVVQQAEDLKTLLDVRDKDNRTALHAAVAARSVECVDLLLKRRAEVDAQDSQSMTPLHLAMQLGAEDCAEQLLDSGANPGMRDVCGRTPLHLGAAGGHAESLELVLTDPTARSTIDVNAADNTGLTPFHLASMNNHTACLRILSERGCSVLCVDSAGRNALHGAVLWGALNAAKTLVERHQLKVDGPDNEGRMPLHYAAVGDQGQIVEWLLEVGADVNARDKPLGRTALHWAARCASVSALRALLGSSDMVATDAHGREAVHLAAVVGSSECLQAVLEAGGTIDAVDKRGITPLYIAAARGFPQLVELLLAEGANASISSAAGLQPVHVGAFKGHRDVIEALLRRIGDSQAVPLNRKGQTPVHLAAIGGNAECLELLAERGIGTPDDVDEAGRTPLHMAAYAGNRECVEWLLEHDASIDVRDAAGETPLFKAAASGFCDICDILLEHGADHTIKDGKNRTVVHAAAFAGDIECLEHLVERCGTDIFNAADADGRIPLHYAPCSSDIDIVQLLLECPADAPDSWTPPVNARTTLGQTPLYVAAQTGDIAIGERLIAAGADASLADENGINPLLVAVARNKAQFLEMLIAKDSQLLKLRDKKGRSALHWAAFCGYSDIVSMLIEHGWQHLDVRDLEGDTPLCAAALAGHTAVVQTLIRAGARVKVRSAVTKLTPLHYGCVSGHANVVQLLIGASADVCKCATKGRTPLHVAALHGHPHLCTVLVQAGADINARDSNGCVALTYAAANGDALVVTRLLELHARTDIADRDGRTPAKHALEHGHVHCRELLEGKTSGFTRVARARANFPFAARDPTELSMDTGNVISVLWQHESGWWKGELDGGVGLFPSNYCDILSAEDDEEAEPCGSLTGSGDSSEAEADIDSVDGIMSSSPAPMDGDGAPMDGTDHPPEVRRASKYAISESVPMTADELESPPLEEEDGASEGGTPRSSGRRETLSPRKSSIIPKDFLSISPGLEQQEQEQEHPGSPEHGIAFAPPAAIEEATQVEHYSDHPEQEEPNEQAQAVADERSTIAAVARVEDLPVVSPLKTRPEDEADGSTSSGCVPLLEDNSTATDFSEFDGAPFSGRSNVSDSEEPVHDAEVLAEVEVEQKQGSEAVSVSEEHSQEVEQLPSERKDERTLEEAFGSLTIKGADVSLEVEAQPAEEDIQEQQKPSVMDVVDTHSSSVKELIDQDEAEPEEDEVLEDAQAVPLSAPQQEPVDEENLDDAGEEEQQHSMQPQVLVAPAEEISGKEEAQEEPRSLEPDHISTMEPADVSMEDAPLEHDEMQDGQEGVDGLDQSHDVLPSAFAFAPPAVTVTSEPVPAVVPPVPVTQTVEQHEQVQQQELEDSVAQPQAEQEEKEAPLPTTPLAGHCFGRQEAVVSPMKSPQPEGGSDRPSFAFTVPPQESGLELLLEQQANTPPAIVIPELSPRKQVPPVVSPPVPLPGPPSEPDSEEEDLVGQDQEEQDLAIEESDLAEAEAADDAEGQQPKQSEQELAVVLEESEIAAIRAEESLRRGSLVMPSRRPEKATTTAGAAQARARQSVVEQRPRASVAPVTRKPVSSRQSVAPKAPMPAAAPAHRKTTSAPQPQKTMMPVPSAKRAPAKRNAPTSPKTVRSLEKRLREEAVEKQALSHNVVIEPPQAQPKRVAPVSVGRPSVAPTSAHTLSSSAALHDRSQSASSSVFNNLYRDASARKVTAEMKKAHRDSKIAEAEATACQFHPTITEKSRALANKAPTGDVWSRLYVDGVRHVRERLLTASEHVHVPASAAATAPVPFSKNQQ